MEPVTNAPEETSHTPVDFSAEAAEAVLAEACRSVGVPAAGARLIRLGENAVFRLAERPIVARIARTAAYLQEIRGSVQVARWLAGIGFPAVRLADGLEQPLLVHGRVVTFWQALSDQYATLADLAVLLRRLHTLTPPDDLGLPEVRPLERTRRRISASSLAPDERAFLSRRADALEARWSELQFALPGGLIHGDASIGNIIRGLDGRPVLIDLDGCATGPREWDLVLTALYFERLGWHTGAEYRGFCELYGFDVMRWPGYRTLRDTRELIMVGWLCQKVGESEAIRAEARRRLEDLRQERAGRLDWQPF